MKTFEEALIAQICIKPENAGIPDSLNLRNTIDIGNEIMSSQVAKGYLIELVKIHVADATVDELDIDAYFGVLMGLTMSAFVVGVRVGMQMEKQEIEEPAQKAGGAA